MDQISQKSHKTSTNVNSANGKEEGKVISIATPNK